MRRFYLLNIFDIIEAEGVLFSSGLVAVSFLGHYSGIMAWPSLSRALHIHTEVGGRRLAWDAKDPATTDLDNWKGYTVVHAKYQESDEPQYSIVAYVNPSIHPVQREVPTTLP